MRELLKSSLRARQLSAAAGGNRACVLLKDLNANLAALTADFQKATAEKLKCQQEADATNRVITLANRYCTERGESQWLLVTVTWGIAAGPSTAREVVAPQQPPCLTPRLIGGLASENVRWAESVEMLRQQENTVCGDVLLISAFVSYVGYFTKKYRTELLEKDWVPFLGELAVSGRGCPGSFPLGRSTEEL